MLLRLTSHEPYSETWKGRDRPAGYRLGMVAGLLPPRGSPAWRDTPLQVRPPFARDPPLGRISACACQHDLSTSPLHLSLRLRSLHADLVLTATRTVLVNAAPTSTPPSLTLSRNGTLRLKEGGVGVARFYL